MSLGEYNGISLVQSEVDALVALEAEIGQAIPHQTEQVMDGFGFCAEDDHVKELVIYDCGLTSIPDSIGFFKSLRLLNLSGNSIVSLPDTFGNLTSLQKLYLGGNGLKSLPESFGNLVNLEELLLYSNNLTALPASFSNLTKL
ncbi:MAG: leucine-rich repeat domain-containing protein, partial [Candidatus Thorarchaeota archaeon]|nr:leucine-rich repeat domain-containing protein [Candidatus Thorarchaeota archaeon]